MTNERHEDPAVSEGRGNWFTRARSSIRTQYSLATAFFLLLILAVFYIGGRIVLVHLIRETEEQVKSAGLDVSRLAYRNADRMKVASADQIAPVAAELAAGRPAADVLMARPGFSLLLGYSAAGDWLSAAQRKEGAVIALQPADLRAYAVSVADWLAKGGETLVEKVPVGILHVQGQSHYVMFVRDPATGLRLILGSPFDFEAFSAQIHDGFGSYEVHVEKPGLKVQREAVPTSSKGSGGIGFALMLSEALDYCPGEPPDGAVFGPEGVVAFAAALATVFTEGRSSRVRMTERRIAGGEPRHFEVRLTRLDELFALAIVRDITPEMTEHQLRVAAEQRAADFLKRESLTLLAAGIAHDVNNILAVILATAESVFADRTDAAPCRVMRDAVKRGQAMTHELMTYAGQSRVTLQRAKAELVVRDVMALAERMVPPTVSLSYSMAPDAPDVDVDPNQFWKVLFNIVKNAGEALGERAGCIRIATERYEMTPTAAGDFTSEAQLSAGSGVLFSITDNGPGIVPELLPRLFDPYVSSKAMGRGLGLATVRTIVEAHGGGIRVKSQLDQGTSFEIFLPASRLPAAASGEEPRPREAGELPAKVLVVDNDEAILKTSAILLRALKVEAHLAQDRKAALGILRRHPGEIGAILLAAHLGGIDTVRLLEAFRIAEPQVRVIVSSGSREEDLRAMFANHPFDAFLGKPYTLAELKAILLR